MGKRMKILLTNDDGYEARGIRLLKEALSADHDVYVSAPLRQMSASGHSITLFRPMEIRNIGEREFAVDGTPADCVKVALFHLFRDIPFDLIVSGVNDGPNMGEDIFYSGTVAGAREGSLNKIFAIACSLDNWAGERYFENTALFVSRLVNGLPREILKERIVLNVNFPNRPELTGVRITHLGERVYKDHITLENRDGKTFVTIGGDDPSFSSDPGSDLDAVAEGFVSITPLVNELYSADWVKKLSGLENISVRS
jgi:5'-nucleotidase